MYTTNLESTLSPVHMVSKFALILWERMSSDDFERQLHQTIAFVAENSHLQDMDIHLPT